jgi:hypothetical protein
MPTLLLPVTKLLETNRKRLGPLESVLRENARWSNALASHIRPPSTYRRRDFSIAGAAYDYWLRAFLAVKFNVKAAQEATVLSQWAESRSDSAYFEEMLFEYPDGKRSLRVVLDDLIRARRAALRSREIHSPEFFENCSDHAQLEGLYRSGQVRYLTCAQSTINEDLEKLAQVTSERQELFAGGSVDVNPRFPRDIFAADGDIAIDDRLIEIKTTSDLIQPLALLQAICYVVIECWDRGVSLSALRYRQIAVYSARHAALGVVHLRDMEPVLMATHAFLREMSQRFGGRKVRAEDAQSVLSSMLRGNDDRVFPQGLVGRNSSSPSAGLTVRPLSGSTN